MKEEAFRKLKLKQSGLELPDEVYSESLTPVRVDVYVDERNHRLYQYDKRLRRCREADGRKPGSPFGPWKSLD
jgi:hypothetical protein